VGEGVTFECPECGRTFNRAPALGAHRRRSHGVVGARRQRASRQRTSADGRPSKVDHDALLQALFPAGLPARAEVLRDLNAWLDEAERIVAAATPRRELPPELESRASGSGSTLPVAS
jgi:endogenous inhibitor of DNA gyrase (YacG/DUF329 family)